jgi:hypothetical protein
MEIKPTDLSRWLVETGDTWATYKRAADLLQESKKPLLGKLIGESNETSQNAKEWAAYRHPDYIEHVRLTVDADFEELKARIRYKAAEDHIELLRTQSANERAINRVST